MARNPEDVEKLLDRLEQFFGEYDSNVDEYNRNSFKERNKEKLGKYEGIMKKLNGENFDIYNESYNEYSNDFKDLDEESYLAKLTVVLDEQINDLKEALGVEQVEIKSDEEGTEIVADEEKTEAPAEEEKVEEKVEEENDDGETEEAELDRIAKSIKKPF